MIDEYTVMRLTDAINRLCTDLEQIHGIERDNKQSDIISDDTNYFFVEE